MDVTVKEWDKIQDIKWKKQEKKKTYTTEIDKM